MDTKQQIVVDYDYIVKTLGLTPEPNFRYFDIQYNDEYMRATMDRSIVLKDGVVVWICTAGSLVVSVDGATHTVTAGQMLIVFAGTYCRFSSASLDFKAMSIVGRISKAAHVDSLVVTFPRVRQMPVVSLLKQESKTLVSLMEFVKATSLNHRNPSRHEIDDNILAILRAELMDIFLRRNLAVREASQDELIVKRFNMLLAVNSFEHRDVEYYAEEFGLSPKRFAAKVKRITGTTPSDLIASAVIKNAKKLLVGTDLSSAEIAERLNFSTPSFFCRYFKRYAGLSPQAWRNENMPQ